MAPPQRLFNQERRIKNQDGWRVRWNSFPYNLSRDRNQVLRDKHLGSGLITELRCRIKKIYDIINLSRCDLFGFAGLFTQQR